MKPHNKFLLYPLIFELLTFICLGGSNLFLVSCNTTEPPPPEKPKNIALKEITKSCTENFLTVSAKEKILPASVKIKRDGKEIMSFYQTGTDTTIIDTALTAGKTYNYQALAEYNGKLEQSKILPVRTLDTTSSNFTWKTYTFGNFQFGSSDLNDVAIINENDIWAVGEIHTADDYDSTGNYLGPYNAVYWNGEKWELKRIMWDNIASRLTCVFAFSSNDVWFGVTNLLHWNGENFEKNWNNVLNEFTDKTVNKIWGKSSNDLYIVGNEGKIAHYNGTSWEKIESGTNLNIIDIWGDKSTITEKTEIICGAYNQIPRSVSDIIRINSDNTTEKLSQIGLGQSYAAVYFIAGLRYYLVGDGLYEKTFKDTTRWVNLNSNRKITSNFMDAIRGNGLNNIIVVGAYGEVLHYNGIRWKSLKNDETTLSNGSYYSVAVKNKTVVAVGYDENGAIILVGKRN
jgi:hypothetical protein